MKEKKLLIAGTGRFAELALIYFAKYSEYEPVAFCVDREYLEVDEHMGVPVVPFEDVQSSHPPESFWLFIGIGYTKANKMRAKKYYEAKEKGYRLATFVSPHLVMVDENTPIGDNTFIFEGQVIQPGVSIGSNVIIWSGNHLGHDAVIHDHVFLTSHVVLAGASEVGEYSFVGVNAAIRDQVKVGKNCIIGAGCTILKNTRDNEVYVDKGTDKFPMDTDTFVRKMKI